MYKVICTSDKRIRRRPVTYEIWFYERPDEHTLLMDLHKEKIFLFGPYTFDIFWMGDV